MTKFILHGGATNLPVESNKLFFKEAAPDLDRKIKILIVYFARKDEDYDRMFEQDVENFKSSSPDKDLELEIASPKPEIFRSQIKNSDVIYVRGGNTLPLLEKIKQVSDFGELIRNKVYAGSSAGMYLVSKYYFSTDREQVEEGLGILPIKAFAHWQENKKEMIEKLKAYKEDLPVYKVSEGEYVIIEQ